MFNSKIISTGSYLPNKIYTNDYLSTIVETNDEWIIERTGIKERRIADENELTSDLAYKSAIEAIKNTNLTPNDIDGIILATTTPDRTFPSTATIVQSKLGINENCFAFDVQAVCAGFLFALVTADNYIKSGFAKRILVIGSETMSRLIDWTDRNTCVLFGDGAGAVILERTEDNKVGILSNSIHSDGQYFDLLKSSGGVSFNKEIGKLEMQGREVFRLAVNKMYASIFESLEKVNLKLEDINLLIPHQANKRILESLAKKIGISEENVIITVDKHANTSSASIPLALDFAVKNNRIKKGDLIVLEALGGGLTWGSSVIKW